MLREAQEHLHQKLVEQGYDNPSNTTLVLLSRILKQPKSYLLAHNEFELTHQENLSLQAISNQIMLGTPLPYILGEWEFYGRKFLVSPEVLIPRPETELLVEKALNLAQNISHPRIVDVGTGSGAIILSMASQLPSGFFIGTDISRSALKIAQENARRFGLSQILFLQANLLNPLHGQFDLICANLPYIPHHKLSKLQVAKSEPWLALDGGTDGLAFICKLIIQAQSRLASNSAMLLEIEASLGNQVLTFAKNAFPNSECNLYQDLAGYNRLLEIRSP